MDEATLEEWRGLYDLAVRFKELAPWGWMDDGDLFAVQSPSDGEMSYGIVMGGGGQEFGLAMFVGDEGFEGYRRLTEGEVEPESLEAGLALRTLSLAFADRRFLDRRDHEVIKALGLKFRGRNAWPMFRSQWPAYAPWYLEREEILLLDIALRFALEVAEGVRDGSLDLYERADDDQVYTLLTEEGEWQRQWTPLPEGPSPTPPPQPDPARLQALRGQSKALQGSLQVDCFLMPVPIGGKGERPRYPRCVLAVHENGFIIGTKLLEPPASEAERQETFLAILEEAGIAPATVEVPSTEVLRLVQPVVETLGGVAEVRDTPVLDDTKGELLHALMRP